MKRRHCLTGTSFDPDYTSSRHTPQCHTRPGGEPAFSYPLDETLRLDLSRTTQARTTDPLTLRPMHCLNGCLSPINRSSPTPIKGLPPLLKPPRRCLTVDRQRTRRLSSSRPFLPSILDIYSHILVSRTMTLTPCSFVLFSEGQSNIGLGFVVAVVVGTVDSVF